MSTAANVSTRRKETGSSHPNFNSFPACRSDIPNYIWLVIDTDQRVSKLDPDGENVRSIEAPPRIKGPTDSFLCSP